MRNNKLDAKDKIWRQCESVKNVWAIESCTSGIKAEAKSSMMVWIGGKKWQMDKQMHPLRNR